jgi:hypothetical protein
MAAIGVSAQKFGAVAFSFVSASVLAGFGIRVLFCGVRIDADHAQIRGVLRTRSIPLSELHRFSFGTLGIFPSVGIAELRDGRRFAITAISTGRVATKKARTRAEAQIDELNQTLAERRA